jgi:hypothetical protein
VTSIIETESAIQARRKSEDKTDLTSVNMSPSSSPKLYFVPIESIVAFVFIGVIVLVGLIARCLALNNSTIRSAQSLDLMIYQPAPRPAPAQKPKHSSAESQFESNGDIQDGASSMNDPVTPTRIQRGPKFL